MRCKDLIRYWTRLNKNLSSHQHGKDCEENRGEGPGCHFHSEQSQAKVLKNFVFEKLLQRHLVLHHHAGQRNNLAWFRLLAGSQLEPPVRSRLLYHRYRLALLARRDACFPCSTLSTCMSNARRGMPARRLEPPGSAPPSMHLPRSFSPQER